VLLSDNFESDTLGSLPAGWTGYGVNAVWTVLTQGSHVLNHAGWSGYIKTGSTSWSNYLYTASVLPSAWASEQDGLLFALTDGGHYSFDILGGTTVVLSKNVNGTSTQLATAPFTFVASRWYNLSVSMAGGLITAYVNGTSILQVTDSSFSAGAVGIEANDPVSFDNVSVAQPGYAVPAPPSPVGRI
jgi:hypothetical protein